MVWPIVLFLLGITLIVLEFVLPGIICGVGGVVLLCISAIMGIDAYPDYAFSIILGEFFGAAVGVAAGLFLLTRTSHLTGLSLETTLSEESGYVNVISNIDLVGRNGVVMTPLRPAGTIVVNGERLDAVSDGSFIGEGQYVRVLEVQGNRVVVELADGQRNDVE
jgi:membrane-bound serine protease (ClpP class)